MSLSFASMWSSLFFQQPPLYANTLTAVCRKWTGHGLLGYEIIMFAPDQPFQLQATLRFDSIESIVKAPTEDIMADIKNYTALEPISVAGQTTALETF